MKPYLAAALVLTLTFLTGYLLGHSRGASQSGTFDREFNGVGGRDGG